MSTDERVSSDVERRPNSEEVQGDTQHQAESTAVIRSGRVREGDKPTESRRRR